MRNNLLYNLLLSISNLLFPLLSFTYAARILGPAGIGKAQFALSFAQYFALFAALGIPVYGIKSIAAVKNSKEKVACTYFELSALYFVASIVISIIYFSCIYYFPYFAQERNIYLIAGLLVLLNFTYSDWYYSGIEAFKTITIRSIVVKAIALLLIFSFVKSSADLVAYLWILVFSILGNQLYSLYDIISKSSFAGIQPEFKKHLKPLVFIFGATLASSIYTFWDTILLGFLSNVTAVGYYTASVKLTKLIIPLVIAFGGVLVPRIANHFGTNNEIEAKKLIANSYNFILFITIPISTGLILLAPELMLFFSGTQFVQATTTMQIVAVLPILIGFGHLFAFQILIPMGKNKEVFLAMVYGLIINVILNFVLIPKFNDQGAAIATVITELVVSGGYLYYVRKSININFQSKLILQSIGLSLLFIPIILFTRAIFTNTFIVTAISISICCLLYFTVQHYLFNNNFVYQIFLLRENKNSHEAEN